MGLLTYGVAPVGLECLVKPPGQLPDLGDVHTAEPGRKRHRCGPGQLGEQLAQLGDGGAGQDASAQGDQACSWPRRCAPRRCPTASSSPGFVDLHIRQGHGPPAQAWRPAAEAAQGGRPVRAVLAGRLGISQSHLSRVELGEAVATVELVGNWTRETAASPGDRQAAAELAQAVSVEFVTWREALASGLVKRQRDAIAAEAAAAVMSAYVPALIPGLMQTSDYATQLVAGKYPDRGDVAEAVAMRMQRQVVLYSRDKTLR